MAWVAVDTFEGYSGDLAGENGGSGWSGAWTNAATQAIEVSTVQKYDGSTSAKVNNASANVFYTRPLTTGVSGNGNIVYFAIRKSLNNSGEISISFRNASNGSRVAVRMNSSGNVTLVGGTTVTLVSGFSVNTWYAIRLTLNVGSGTATAATNTGGYQGGGAWSAESSSVSLTNSGNIDTVGIGGDSNAGNDYFDTITATDPTTVPVVAGNAMFMGANF